MTEKSYIRRYLVGIDSNATQQLFTDCLVVGAGIAGLRAALEAAEHCNVIIACKATLEDSNTFKAQGGIASVLHAEDSLESHVADTLSTGCGLCNESIVRLVVEQGPELLRQLLDWGTEFDLEDGRIAITLEGGHSHPRVAHAHGDATGRVIAERLIRRVRRHPNIRTLENFYAIDLLTTDANACQGLIGQTRGHEPQIIWAANTILATGGAGQIYRETTNPQVATGDGLAMAYRAGATLRDMEFVQFHPTTLYIAGASRALITETLRGEGAVLRDCNGEAFMSRYHESAELAPRDIVSRAILARMLETDSTHVYLDVRHLDKEHIARRFPVITDLCAGFSIDPATDLIPVRPSAHYMIGGVATDINGRTGVDHLYACGEVAATGLHGANRLGSNSLLEGLVFGRITGRAVAAQTPAAHIGHPRIKYQIPPSDRTLLDAADVRNSLRALMWRNVGITRKDRPLTEAQEIIRFWQRYVMDKAFDCSTGWECQNMLTVCLLIANAAQKRCESRGTHFRSDHDQPNDPDFKRHIDVTRTDD